MFILYLYWFIITRASLIGYYSLNETLNSRRREKGLSVKESLQIGYMCDYEALIILIAFLELVMIGISSYYLLKLLANKVILPIYDTIVKVSKYVFKSPRKYINNYLDKIVEKEWIEKEISSKELRILTAEKELSSAIKNNNSSLQKHHSSIIECLYQDIDELKSKLSNL